MIGNNTRKAYYKASLIILFSLMVVTISFSQSFEWNAGFHGFFDNREYFNEYTSDQTIFGSRLFADVGFAVNEQNRFCAGFSYMYEFGSKGSLIEPDLTLYYNYGGRINFYMGAFPRYELIHQPLILQTDTLNYYRPNIEGIYLEFKRLYGYHNLWIDWTGRQTSANREIFLIGGSGRLKAGSFFYEHHFNLCHYALPDNALPEEHIRDNGGLITMVGIDLSAKHFIDTLSISSGVALSYDRLRNVYSTMTALGWYSELRLNYKGLGINGTFYLGDNHSLIYGDKFYGSESYQRIDLYYRIQKSKQITGALQFSFHFIPGIVDYSQMLVLYICIEGKKKLNQNIDFQKN